MYSLIIRPRKKENFLHTYQYLRDSTRNVLVKTSKELGSAISLRYPGTIWNDSWTYCEVKFSYSAMQLVIKEMFLVFTLRYSAKVLCERNIGIKTFGNQIPVGPGKPALARVGVPALRCGMLNVQSGQLLLLGETPAHACVGVELGLNPGCAERWKPPVNSSVNV